MNPLTPYLGIIKAAAVAAILLALFAFGFHAGAKHVQTKWDLQTAQLVADAAAANHENSVIASRRQSNVIEAQNEATRRNKTLQVAAAAARSQSDSLRDELAALRRDLPGLAADTVRQHADALASVLGDCQRDYQGMAAAAGAHASDVKLLQDAWPKK